MRKFLILSLFIIGHSFCHANQATFYNKIMLVNSEWQKQPDVSSLLLSPPDLPLSFSDAIATHLMLVEQTLRQRPTETHKADRGEPPEADGACQAGQNRAVDEA